MSERRTNEHWENAPDKVKLALYEYADKHNLTREQFNFIRRQLTRTGIDDDVYYWFEWNGMFHGIELDGHIHT